MTQISTVKRKRRTYSAELKTYLVEQALMGDRSIASIAQGHGINPNLLQKWIRTARHEQNKTVLPQTLTHTPNHNIIEHEPTFLPVILQPELTHEHTTSITVSAQRLTGVQLQIPSQHRKPINLSIDQIDTHSLIELLRGLQ